MLGPIKNSLSLSEVNNLKSPRSTKEKVEVQADFLRKKNCYLEGVFLQCFIYTRYHPSTSAGILGSVGCSARHLWRLLSDSESKWFKSAKHSNGSITSTFCRQWRNFSFRRGRKTPFDPLHARHTQWLCHANHFGGTTHVYRFKRRLAYRMHTSLNNAQFHCPPVFHDYSENGVRWIGSIGRTHAVR